MVAYFRHVRHLKYAIFDTFGELLRQMRMLYDTSAQPRISENLTGYEASAMYTL